MNYVAGGGGVGVQWSVGTYLRKYSIIFINQSFNSVSKPQ